MFKNLLIALGFIVALAGGAVLFAWSGIFNVAASSGHPAPVAWFLHFTMKNSVRTHALGIAPPEDLQSRERIVRGAAHYDLGCAPCHGAPGAKRNAIVTEMLPPPPHLADQIETWKPSELFWIVKHGIKYAGMPAWPARNRDDEIWDVTAFLLEMPRLDAEGYAKLARGTAGSGTRSETDRKNEPSTVQEDQASSVRIPLHHLAGDGQGPSIETCARCHGYDGNGRGGDAFPKLAGQPESYLTLALADYASGSRKSGFMETVASKLEPVAMTRLARQFSAFERSSHGARLPDSVDGNLARGSDLARFGDPAIGLPACVACHGQNAGNEASAPSPKGPPAFPVLRGQNAGYLVTQLRLFENGGRGGTRANLMRMIAGRLSEGDMADLAAYYASLTPSGEERRSDSSSRQNTSAASR